MRLLFVMEIFPWILVKASPRTVELTESLLMDLLASNKGDGVLLVSDKDDLEDMLDEGLDKSVASN